MSTPSPNNALTPQVMLAAAMHAQPGVYAVLLGSGVSTGAGIPTAWGVVQELLRRVAAASNPGDADAAERAAADPEEWWQAHGDGQALGYSSLLAALAPTPATRQGLLAAFFQPTDDDREAGNKIPSDAHHAVAELVKRGTVRVVLTTNFDRLTEQALEAAEVSPQVVARPEAVRGMTPLAHAKATVVKLHGDYADLGLRNTAEELSAYPDDWNKLLDQVFNEFGLIVAGWSVDWDTALVAALERSPSRRYPLYWDSRSGKGDTARRLLTLRSGHEIAASGADELFTDLCASVEALDRLAEPPLTTAMAVSRLKRYLPDPVRRIDLHDLVMGAVDRAVESVREQPLHIEGLDAAGFEQVQAGHLRAVTPLLQLLATGVWHDQAGEHDGLWQEVLQRLIDARSVRGDGALNQYLMHAQHYPALLALQTIGVVTVHRGHDGLLIRLLTEVSGRDSFGNLELVRVAQMLHMNRVLDANAVNGMPRWSGQHWRYPQSHLLREDLREVLREFFFADVDYKIATDDYEFRTGLVQETTQDSPGAYRAASGEFVGDGAWTFEGDPRAEQRLWRDAEKEGSRSPWWGIGGTEQSLEAALLAYRDILKHYRHY